VRLAVAREVGEEPVRAGVVQLHAGEPGAVALLTRMKVLEAREVAAGEDQVHALLVRDVEVAHRPAAGVHDAEREAFARASPQVRVVHDDAQAVLGHRESADRMLLAGVTAPGVAARSGLGVAGLGSALGVRGLRRVAVRVDGAAREGGPARHQGEEGRESGELRRSGHGATS
jgi:hypothetical protein